MGRDPPEARPTIGACHMIHFTPVDEIAEDMETLCGADDGWMTNVPDLVTCSACLSTWVNLSNLLYASLEKWLTP